MVIVRYEGPSGAPGMPEMLDPTSRITALCRERGIIVGADDGCPLLRRLGRPRHRPRRTGGGARRPDRVHRERRRDRRRPQQERAQLHGAARPCHSTRSARRPGRRSVAGNGGIHPNCGTADTRLLHRARHTAVPATRGGGLHPNREVWVREPRQAERSGFVPSNKHRPQANKAFLSDIARLDERIGCWSAAAALRPDPAAGRAAA